MSTKISKSKFCAGVQCLKRLYWQVHEPELAAEPSGATEAIMEQGHDVGMLARTLFPRGVEVCERSLDQAIRTTRELVANPNVSAIFEAVFEHQNVLVKVDVLHRRRDGRWRLIEVKSTSDVKDHHYEDVAIQYRVVSRSGLDVASVCLAHVNRNFIYPGGEIDPRRFFRIRNLPRRVQRLQPKLTFQLRSEFTVLAMPKAPDIAPGRHCADPVTCEFFDRCNPPRPNDHIGYLPRLHASAAEELEEMGVESIRDIPDEFELTDIQRRAATCVQTGEPWFDTDGLKTELAALRYPVAYLDFETVNPAIPRFASTRPYQQIAFQWSAHIQHRAGEEPKHYAFLATTTSDPRREFLTSMLAALPNTGSIVVYNQQFESARLDELAEATLDGTRKEHMEFLVTVPLLILDDLGMRKLPLTAAEELLEIIMRRYERASTMLTSNRPVEDWGKLLGDAAAVSAMLDRLLHHGHVLKCGPRSWRTKTDLPPQEAAG